MKKVTLIQCYSDNNYGDLGIILTTVDLLHETNSNIEINCISTYNSSDPRYQSEHVLLKQKISSFGGKVYPSIFGIVDRTKGLIYIRSLINLIRFLIVLPFVNIAFVRRFLLTADEEVTYGLIKESDVIISKGGSFFCDDNGKLGSLSFFRLWYIMLFSIKLKKKTAILAQSIGPLNSSFSKLFGNYLLKRMDAVVLREDYCLKKYPYFADRKYIINNDVVFYQNIYTNHVKNTELGNIVGVTIKYVDKDQELYKSTMSKIIDVLVNKYGLKVRLLPQVPLDGDLIASQEIKSLLNIETQNNVEIIENFYNIEMLIEAYSKLDFVVGTRLHSCIFSWSVGVPAINISYHGTKSEGIYSNLGIKDWVLDYSNPDVITSLQKLVDEIIIDREQILEKVTKRIQADKSKMLEIINELIADN